MATTKKTPAKTESTEVALFGDKNAELPAFLQSAGSGLGNEDVTSEDLSIPRLSLLQALSPQINGDATQVVDNAKPGQFHISLTDELHDDLFCINLAYKRDFAVFRKREHGGGFHGNFGSLAEAQDRVNQLEGNPESYEIQETAKHFLLLLDSDGTPVQPVAFFMANTKLAVSRSWNSKIRMLGENLDRFASVWHLTPVKQSGAKGSWYNLGIEFAGWTTEDLYNHAKRTYHTVMGTPEAQGAGNDADAA